MSSYSDRLAALRDQLARDRLDGFVVPLTDEHMSEYVGAYAQRLAWLTGFHGSAGAAVVLPDDAAIFTDGRYTIQVREQVDGNDWAYVPVPEHSIAGWLGDHASDGARIGYDPWLHTRAWVAETRAALADVGADLVAVDANPVDAIWADRPQPSKARLTAYDAALAGRNSASKRAEIADWLAQQRADAVVLTALDSIAWALNVRGADVDHTPVALSYAIVGADGATDLYVDGDKIDEAVVQHLGNSVRIHDRLAFAPALAGYAGKRVAADPERAVAAIFDALEAGGARVLAKRDPVVLAKAIKNPVETAGHRSASARDGAAVARDLAYEAARHADFILIPTKTAVFDTMSMTHTLDVVRQLDRAFAVVLTFVPPQGQETGDAIQAVAELGATVCPVTIGNRKAFFRAQAAGRAVQEFEPHGPAADEIRRLYEYTNIRLYNQAEVA